MNLLYSRECSGGAGTGGGEEGGESGEGIDEEEGEFTQNNVAE